MSTRDNLTLSCLSSFSASQRLKGNNRIFPVNLLCKPPLLLIILLTIYEEEDPQIITRRSFLLFAKLFQKCSNAGRKSDFFVSIQGNSSKKMTFLFFEFNLSRYCLKISNASIQFLGFLIFLCFSERVK